MPAHDLPPAGQSRLDAQEDPHTARPLEISHCLAAVLFLLQFKPGFLSIGIKHLDGIQRILIQVFAYQ